MQFEFIILKSKKVFSESFYNHRKAFFPHVFWTIVKGPLPVVAPFVPLRGTKLGTNQVG